MPLSTTPDLTALTAAGFRALARRALDPEPRLLPTDVPSRGPSDSDLSPEPYAEVAPVTERPAAVLVPVVARQELTFLLTLRTDHLPAHAGQIAFPGGKVEEHDSGPAATALREAAEEIGLDRELVEPLGFLDYYRTGTGYCIAPLVALVDPDYSLTLNTEEVVDAFEIPLPFLMDTRNHRIHVRTIGGRERRFYAMPYGERFIWGATAGILRTLHERLFGS